MMHLRDLRTAVPAQLLSPFTGEPVKALGRVIVAKIDNIADARPPTNLTSADIVYLLPVEGGLSRIFAVYSSRIPKVIGRCAAPGRTTWRCCGSSASPGSPTPVRRHTCCRSSPAPAS